MAMGEARSRQLWNHTSSMLAMIANALLRRKGRPAYQPKQFNPHARLTPKPPVTEEESQLAFRMMRRAFVKPAR